MEKQIEKLHTARICLKAEYTDCQKMLVKQLKKLEETFKNDKEYDKEFERIFKDYNSTYIIFERELHTLRIYKPEKKERKEIQKIIDRYDYDFT